MDKSWFSIPVDWFTWFYGQYFVGHSWRGFLVVSAVLSAALMTIIAPFWFRAVSNYSQLHTNAAAPKVEAKKAPTANGGKKKQSKLTLDNRGSVGGSVTQGPGSIALIGGSHNQATVNNIGVEPPLPNVTWTSKPLATENGENPAVEVELNIDKPLSNPTFHAICDRPWESEQGSIHVAGAMFQTQRGVDETNPNVAILHFNIPNIITPGTAIGWTLRSKDAQQIRVLEVKAITLQ